MHQIKNMSLSLQKNCVILSFNVSRNKIHQNIIIFRDIFLTKNDGQEIGTSN